MQRDNHTSIAATCLNSITDLKRIASYRAMATETTARPPLSVVMTPWHGNSLHGLQISVKKFTPRALYLNVVEASLRQEPLSKKIPLIKQIVRIIDNFRLAKCLHAFRLSNHSLV